MSQRIMTSGVESAVGADALFRGKKRGKKALKTSRFHANVSINKIQKKKNNMTELLLNIKIVFNISTRHQLLFGTLPGLKL